MNSKAQLQFVGQCSTLLGAGISLREALSIIISMEKRKKQLLVLHEIRKGVDRGLSLSKSISLSERRFDSELVSVISFGEEAGILPVSLTQAREMREKTNLIKKKIIGALVYPSFIALATGAMTLFLVMYIFPKILPLFSSLDIPLPLLTKAILALYLFLTHYGVYFVITCIFLSLILVAMYTKHTKSRKIVQYAVIQSPIIGNQIKKYAIAGHMRTIGTLLECGQSLPKILHRLSTSTYIQAYSQALKNMHEKTLQGATLSSAISSFPVIFPTLVSSMVSIGERTGCLSLMCKNIASIYEIELDDFIKHVSTSIEPLLMIIMGLVVGSVALSIVLPIYEITNHLSR